MTVLGLNLVLANLNRKALQIMEAEGDGLEEAGKAIRDAWVRNIEIEEIIDTGRYHDSISVAMEDGQAIVYTDVPYARFLEFGTSDTPAHPAAERAADEHHDDVLDAVGREVGGVL